MRLLGIIPRELRDVKTIAPEKLLVIFDDGIYEAKLGKKTKIKEIGRWTGASAFSVESLDDKKLLGTSIGVVVFSNKAVPLYTGGRTILFSGNFSPNHKIAAFVQMPDKIERILDVFFIGGEDFSDKKRILRERGQEITFFGTNIGPVEIFRYELLKNLVLIKDIDKDNLDELLILTPEEIAPRIEIIDYNEGNETWDLYTVPLPEFLREPLQLASGDIDGDGEDEILILSRRSPLEYVLSLLEISKLEDNKYQANVYALAHIRADELFKNVSDDGFLQVKLLDNELPSILLMWIEAPNFGECFSKLYFSKLDIDGSFTISKTIYEEFMPKRLILNDENLANEEFLIISDIGFSLWRIKPMQLKGFKVIKNGYFYTPARISAIKEVGDRLFLAGLVLSEPRKISAMYMYDANAREFEIIGIYDFDVKSIIRTSGNDLAILTDNGARYYDARAGKIVKLVTGRNIRDIKYWNGRILVAKENAVLEFWRKSESRFSKRVIYKSAGNERIFSLIDNLGKLLVAAYRGEDVIIRSLKGELVAQKKSLLKSNGGRFLKAVMIDQGIIIFSNIGIEIARNESERNEVVNLPEEIVKIEELKGFKKEGFLISAGSSLFFLSPDQEILVSHILSNVTAFDLKDNRLIVVTIDNKIAEFDVPEVIEIA